MAEPLESFSPDAPNADIVVALRRDGGVVITDLVPDDVMDSLAERVAGELQETKGVIGAGNRTFGGLLANGPELVKHLLLNERVHEVADAILLPQEPMAPSSPKPPPQNVGMIIAHDGCKQYLLPTRDPETGPNCHHYKIGSAVGLEVRGGGKHQVLHREIDVYAPYFGHDPEGPELIIAAMWAATDFTAENGATRLAPGSHRWSRDRAPTERDVVQAVMPKGSVLIWLGRVFHGAAASTADDARTGLLYTLVPNWLTQEENQYLTVPPEVARDLPKAARQLIGYRAAGSVGWVKGRDAEDLLEPGRSGPL